MSPAPSSGLLGSLRQLGDSLLAAAQDRLGLLALELREEKTRLVQTFVWISAAAFTGMMALVFISLTIVYLFWERARLGVLIALAVIYCAAFVAVVVAFRRHLARQPGPIDATLGELAEDRSCIPREP